MFTSPRFGFQNATQFNDAQHFYHVFGYITATSVWRDVTNILELDDAYAINSDVPTWTYLWPNRIAVINPKFALNGAQVFTIEVRIECVETDFDGGTGHNELYLYKNGNITGSNRASGAFPSVESFQTFGSTSDSWGITQSFFVADSQNFGLRYRVLQALTGQGETKIDYFDMRVTYTAPFFCCM